MGNKTAYESQDVVRHFSKINYLFTPEKEVFNNFKKKFKNMRMLDIGIGSGRTTYYFSGLTKSYIGIDYAKNMITACKSRFSNRSKNISFKVCDVRDMTIFKNHTFDFILFSWNGLDCISHKDRLKSLREIKRICKKGGLFFFSAHNLQNINKLFPIKLSQMPVETLKTILRYFLIRLLNKNKKLKNNKYVIIQDRGVKFRFLTYYIRPEEQIKQLKDIGFKNIIVYSLNGKTIDKSKLDTIKDNFIYYLCEKI